MEHSALGRTPRTCTGTRGPAPPSMAVLPTIEATPCPAVPGIAGKGQSGGVEPFHADLSRWASGVQGRPPARAFHPGLSHSARPARQELLWSPTRSAARGIPRAIVELALQPQAGRSPGPAHCPSSPRGQWLWPLFSGRQSSAGPPSLCLDPCQPGISRLPRCPGDSGSPCALGGPASLTVAGAPGTRPTVGSVRKRPRAGHWNLAVLQGRSHRGRFCLHRGGFPATGTMGTRTPTVRTATITAACVPAPCPQLFTDVDLLITHGNTDVGLKLAPFYR